MPWRRDERDDPQPAQGAGLARVVDRYGELARRDLPEIQRPVGYVVIGRDTGCDENTHRRLQQRNAVFGGAVQVLTWDGLLQRASTLLRQLEGLSTLAT